MDDLLYDITGLVGICLLLEPYDSTDYVSNESSEDKDSIFLNSIMCHRETLFLPHVLLPLLHNYDVMYFTIFP